MSEPERTVYTVKCDIIGTGALGCARRAAEASPDVTLSEWHLTEGVVHAVADTKEPLIVFVDKLLDEYMALARRTLPPGSMP